MMQGLRWTGIVLLVLLLLVAALWSASRLLGPTAEQRRAVAVFEQLPEPEGSNAFPSLWLLQWDVPESEQAAVVAEDAERFRALPPWGDPARGEATRDLASVAAGRWWTWPARFSKRLSTRPQTRGRWQSKHAHRPGCRTAWMVR